MKTEFELEVPKDIHAELSIVGKHPNNDPYIKIEISDDNSPIRYNIYLKDEDRKRLAINILKALGKYK